MFGLKESDIEILQKLGKEYSDIEQLIIFGSRAMGNYKPGSDVDLAIVGNISQQELLEIDGLLNDELPTPYFYDVLAVSELRNKALLEHIHQFGKVVYQKENVSSIA